MFWTVLLATLLALGAMGVLMAVAIRPLGTRLMNQTGILATGFLIARPSATPIQGGAAVNSASSLPTYVATLAHTVATQMGDAVPSSMSVVLTTRQAAVRAAMASQVTTNPPVYFVEIRGQFVDRYARIPPGQPFPTGSTIMLTIDTQTHTILDFSISNQTFDLSSQGTAIPLT